MKQDRHKRKMSAIFSADVVGYSRLMEEDEAWAIKNIEENKSLISSLIEDYHGRVVDTPGDNILAEFSSVTNAVECAVKIQEELKKKNANIVENRRMEFRIGINLGEIVEEGGRIYGSGVNIAARIEGLSKSGGICISGRTYDHVKTKFHFGYEYLGEHNVKNISEPIRVYRLLMESKDAGKVIGEKKVPSLISHRIALAAVIILIIITAVSIGWNIYSRKTDTMEETVKTIAVLAFENMSPEEDQGYFADGLSEEIINSLCQIHDLNVTGRTSSFAFKGKGKTAQEIAKELEVKYILEGSVRKVENALRITAQLLRGADGFHLWSKIYNKELKSALDIYTIQEDIATAVADELKLTLGANKSFKQLGGTDNLKAYELYLNSIGKYINMDYEGAIESVNEAVRLDPKFAEAWVFKGAIHMFISNFSSADQVSLELEAGLNATQGAIEIEPDFGFAYEVLGTAFSARGEFFEAESVFQKARDLGNNAIFSLAPGQKYFHYWGLGYFKNSFGTIADMRKDDPLNQITRTLYIYNLGCLGYLEQAEEEYKHCKTIFDDPWIYGDFAITWLRSGTKEVLSMNDIPESMNDRGSAFAIGIEHMKSPKEGLIELHKLYSSAENESSHFYRDIAFWAAYFGEPDFALDAWTKSFNLNTMHLMFIWSPAMKTVRQFPQFKEFARKCGMVDYWKKYGWPDFCRPIGDDDFECE